jgi:hypothetical protein
MQWTDRRVDRAINEGLNFLARSAVFSKLFDQGGEHAMHHFLLDQILARHPHQVLRAQRDYCDRANQRIARWRAFNGLPGWPKEPVDVAAKAEIEQVIREYDNPYGRWLLWATHASWATLPSQDYHRLFEDTTMLKSSYELTHALITYWLVQRMAPETSERLKVTERIAEVLRRIERYTTWAPRCSDSYHERVAFSLMIEPPPAISRRWIERILTVQNADGGWMYVPPYSRTVQEMFGLEITNSRSDPHSTLLAVLALTYYHDRIRTERGADQPRLQKP